MMKKLAFGALFVGLLAACGGGDDGPSLIDGGDDSPDADTACNAVAQTGCLANEKCTWINVAADLGKVGCVPDGSVAIGDTCDYGPDGEDSGYDNCAAGGICIGTNAAGMGGACEEVCTVTPDSCPAATSTCSSYNGLFTGTAQATGACDFTCNPGNGERKFDNAPACDSTNAAMPNKGCYGYFDQVPYSCTPNVSTSVHGAAPMPLSPTGSPFLNSCAPGYQLFQRVEGMDATVLCIANCVPEESFGSGSPVALTGREDGIPPNDLATRGVLEATFVCQYMHFWYAAGTETTAGDVNGIALDPLGWAYDLDGTGPGTAEGPFPTPIQTTDCNDLAMVTCNASWGYAPFPPAATAVKKLAPFTLAPIVPQKRYR